jgi:hypothetical protein
MYSTTLTLTVSVMVHIYLSLRLQCTSWYILTYCSIDSFSPDIYLPVVTLTVSVMVYTYLLQRWQCRSWYVLNYCNVDSVGHGILYSYLMGVQSIDQTLFPRYWKSPKWYIARGQRSRSIEHFCLSQYRGKHCLIYCLHSHEITVLLPNYKFFRQIKKNYYFNK